MAHLDIASMQPCLISNKDFKLNMTITQSEAPKNLYKVLSKQEWEAASQSGKIATDLDQKDGFVHLSSALQLNATLTLYFAEQEEAVLLQIKQQIIEDGLTFEHSEKRGGEFAHLYGDLLVEHTSQTWFLERGAFILPTEILQEAEQTLAPQMKTMYLFLLWVFGFFAWVAFDLFVEAFIFEWLQWNGTKKNDWFFALWWGVTVSWGLYGLIRIYQAQKSGIK
jgi:uncharacterized protein (DUF952 family)